ncbi:MAG: hypothetical protein EBT03_00555 [Betaproteobacteria bacterium]|nr:hypothetical protein [Betaproteobacteria bacterium]NCA16338.1 hypothetical protein [Betaproteobacteria bacterium]
MSAKLRAVVLLPALISALITLMIMGADGPASRELLLLVFTLAMLTMSATYVQLQREKTYGLAHARPGTPKSKKKVPRPRVASDLTRTIALSVVCCLLGAVLFMSLISPKRFYSHDIIGFFTMVATFVCLSSVVWYGLFPRPRKPPKATEQALPALEGPAGQVALNPDGTPMLNADGTPVLLLTGPDGESLAQPDQVTTLSPEEEGVIELQEGESLEDIKKRLKPRKPKVSLDMLNTANSYDDKVALLRFLVAEDSSRVTQALQKSLKT